MRLLKALWMWLQICGALVATVAILWLSAQWAFHLKLLTVQTGSMRPTFKPGDALLLQRVDSSALKSGVVVSYRSSRNPNELVTHRVSQVHQGQGSFQTKGDALTVPDPTVRDSLLIGRVTTVLPGMGKLLNWLRSWPGLIVCVYTPVGIIAVSELYRLERSYTKSRAYHLITESSPQ
jgi:signal peptidase